LAKEEALLDPIENVEFVEKFKSTFIQKVKDIKHALNIIDPIIIVGKDCPRKNIWRHGLIHDYKSNRENDGFQGKSFFKMAYDTLFVDAGVDSVISYDTLEADDCIAITVERILESVENHNIWIITSDMDYLQLASDRVHIYNLKYQDITKSKTATGNAECDKFCKIICGDKSDCIAGVFKNCGLKTALKLYADKDAFEKKLNKFPGARERLRINTQLIDFKMIPGDLREGFRREVLEVGSEEEA